MSQAGTIRLTVKRKDAERVGLLTVRRAKRLPLGHTPLKALPIAGDKLQHECLENMGCLNRLYLF